MAAMYTDRSLATLLRALQIDSDEQDVARLLGSATTLLTLLSNPLNVTLLTSQLLSAALIWQRPDGLRTTIRILSIFSSAAVQIIQSDESIDSPQPNSPKRTLGRDEWVSAVVKGADSKSPRWRHLCVLTGLLIGFGARNQANISMSLRRELESAIEQAVNLALQEAETSSEFARSSIAMMLSHAFDLLGDGKKLNFNHDLLLPILIHASFFSKEGLHYGYFLSTIDSDVVQNEGMKFDWSPHSSTYVQCQRMDSAPLMSSLGSLSRMTAFSVENVRNVDFLLNMMKDISEFTRSLYVQWQQNKLSEIDIKEESVFLSKVSLSTTIPLLWRILKNSMFAVIIILRSLLGRMLGDVRMPEEGAPFVAIQTLQVLRNMYFISSRPGANAFSQYNFVFLTAIDVLSQYPTQVEAFLRDIRPSSAGSIPPHPLDRCHDLFFLNTAEHFTIILASELNEELLINAATPYLGLGSDKRLLEIFEAAHSVMLAVLSAPQNSDVLSRYIRPYVDVLFKVFPQNLSARQFRIAIKTLVRITSPPAPISQTQPLLPSILLDLVRLRLETASSGPLQQAAEATTPKVFKEDGFEQSNLTEQSVLVLTLTDALSFLPTEQLEDWLPIVADSMNTIENLDQQHKCKQRFWEVLSNGGMDVDRAAICVTWWGTRGGRDSVIINRNHQTEGPFMSGGRGETSKL